MIRGLFDKIQCHTGYDHRRTLVFKLLLQFVADDE